MAKTKVGTPRGSPQYYWTAISIAFLSTGSGYQEGSSLTIKNNRGTPNLILRVATVVPESGAIGTYTTTSAGAYKVEPPQDNDTRTLAGTGSGARLRITWQRKTR